VQDGLVSAASFAEHLAAMDPEGLTELVRSRPEVCLEPVPRTFAELAQRLDDPQSLATALHRCRADALTVGLVIAGLGERADRERVLAVCDSISSEPQAVGRNLDAALAELSGSGLCFQHGAVYRLSGRLREHFLAEIGGGRPLAKILNGVRVDDLRPVVDALGLEPASARKQDLVAALAEFVGDPVRLAGMIAGLPDESPRLLDRLRYGGAAYFGGGAVRQSPALDRLCELGLAYPVNYSLELPAEVAAGAALALDVRPLSGPPELDAGDGDADRAAQASTAAAQGAVQALTRLLDAAHATPIAALKKGGIGVRERARLAKKLSFAEQEMPLWLDIAGASELMERGAAGYVPGADYPEWRAAEPAARWARLADAWCALAHAPTRRDDVEDRAVPPPLAQYSTAGTVRRALLRAARGGASVRDACAHLDWFAPLHGYDEEELPRVAEACVREGESLGVLAMDAVSPLGERLGDVAHLPAAGRAGELAACCAGMLPETESSVLLQSDMTAVVSGQPSAAASGLLHEAAVAETRGAGSVWRFTEASVRHAMDQGWTREELLARLAELSGRGVPQPLEYLVSDVARKHGSVRVREVTSCLVAAESEVQELLHARALRGLELRQLAPTVLTSPVGSEQVLAKLRAAGFAPMAEDSGGAVVLPAESAAPPPSRPARRGPPSRMARPEDVVAGLAAEPSRPAEDGGTVQRLAQLNGGLAEAELRMLAHALEAGASVVISYQSKTGTHTTREIRPRSLYGRWLDSWCCLRQDQRDFTVARIEAVSPA
jgi:hypothetical protein